jgi:7,8-dihydroneopterin aldolase/epimerase/oxygenase
VTERVRLLGIEVEGRHGVHQDEQEHPQPFEVDLELVVEAKDDDLASTADYEHVVSVVRELVATDSYRLIETLAGRVASAVAELPGVGSCRAVVRKPRAADRLRVRVVSAEATAPGRG